MLSLVSGKARSLKIMYSTVFVSRKIEFIRLVLCLLVLEDSLKACMTKWYTVGDRWKASKESLMRLLKLTQEIVVEETQKS